MLKYFLNLRINSAEIVLTVKYLQKEKCTRFVEAMLFYFYIMYTKFSRYTSTRTTACCKAYNEKRKLLEYPVFREKLISFDACLVRYVFRNRQHFQNSDREQKINNNRAENKCRTVFSARRHREL